MIHCQWLIVPIDDRKLLGHWWNTVCPTQPYRSRAAELHQSVTKEMQSQKYKYRIVSGNQIENMKRTAEIKWKFTKLHGCSMKWQIFHKEKPQYRIVRWILKAP